MHQVAVVRIRETNIADIAAHHQVNDIPEIFLCRAAKKKFFKHLITSPVSFC
jgi:hypothetical protein